MSQSEKKHTVINKKPNNYQLSYIIAGAVGCLLTLLSLPLLAHIGLFPANVIPDSTAPITHNLQVNTAITEAVAKCDESVVGVYVTPAASLNNFFSPQKHLGQAGSGVIISSQAEGDKPEKGEALVLTNAHVVKEAADNEQGNEITISFASGKQNELKNSKGTVVGIDRNLDLAVIKIDAKHVTKTAEIGNSDLLKTGEPVLAMGNPLGLGKTVSQGIISRPLTTMDIPTPSGDKYPIPVIQTDATVNPGNSGGPLVNAAGKVIGLTTFKAPNGQGISYAIPIKAILKVLPALKKGHSFSWPYMGLENPIPLNLLPPNAPALLKLPSHIKSGVVLAGVRPNSPAAKARLRKYDMIVKLDNKPINSNEDIKNLLFDSKKPGDPIEIEIYRNGELTKVTLTLTNYPENRVLN
ncbi:MAG: Serine protease Do-like HtrB [Bacillota bacterium]|jgi:serine protease Do